MENEGLGPSTQYSEPKSAPNIKETHCERHHTTQCRVNGDGAQVEEINSKHTRIGNTAVGKSVVWKWNSFRPGVVWPAEKGTGKREALKLRGHQITATLEKGKAFWKTITNGIWTSLTNNLLGWTSPSMLVYVWASCDSCLPFLAGVPISYYLNTEKSHFMTIYYNVQPAMVGLETPKNKLLEAQKAGWISARLR